MNFKRQWKKLYQRRITTYLPKDFRKGTFIGRFQTQDGPTILALSQGELFDITKDFPTFSHLLRKENPLEILKSSLKDKTNLNIETLFENTFSKKLPYLLSPIGKLIVSLKI